MSYKISFNATSAVAFAAGCPSNITSTSLEMITCLRSLSMSTLLSLTEDFITDNSANNDGDVFLPTVVQDFLPDLASTLVATGQFPQIAYIAGWMENDATLFTNSAIETDNDTRAFFEL